jgi:hypothetical protein
VFRYHDGVGKRDGRPMASATAMPCASMPSEPSVMIQVFLGPGFAACGDQRLSAAAGRTLRSGRLGRRVAAPAKISATCSAQFLFDSFD